MQVKLKKHASRVDEAIALASRVIHGSSYETVKKSVLEKYHFNTFDVETMFDDRIRLEKAFIRDFKESKDALDFYFQKHSDVFDIASILSHMPYFQTEKRKCRVIFDEEDNRLESFVTALVATALVEENPQRKVKDFEQLVSLLDKMDIEDEDKWLLQGIYRQMDRYYKNFVVLINKIVEWLGQEDDLINKEEENFYNYWQNCLAHLDFKKHIAKNFNITVPEGMSMIWVLPAYFDLTGINYEIKDNVFYLYIGMLFDEKFSFETTYETPLLLCSHLKVLSDPSKFEILRVIKERPYYGSELARLFDLSTPTISHHMASLENAGFIKTEKRDNRTYYVLDRERMSLFLKQVHNMLVSEDPLEK